MPAQPSIGWGCGTFLKMQMYHCTTVPPFMFQLTKGELEILKSQIVISNVVDNQDDRNWKSQIVTSNFVKMGLRKASYAFTENGVAMLNSVLRSPLAIQVNIGIMRAFTEFLDIEDILHDQNDINESTRMQLENITLALSEFQTKEPKQKPRLRHCGVAPMRVSLTYSFQLYFLILGLWPVVITLVTPVKMTSFLQIVLPFCPILCPLYAQILIYGNKRMAFNPTVVNDSVSQT